VVNEIYYYFGKPGGDAGMFDGGGNILSANNNLQMSELLEDEVSPAGAKKARGIREIIQKRNKAVLDEINKLKDRFKAGEINQEAYDSLSKKVRKDENLPKPVIIIKSTPQASYGALVSVLDEMQINNIAKYQIDNMTRVDSVMLIDYQNNHHK
jgi:biopolymer transport protein ExbD